MSAIRTVMLELDEADTVALERMSSHLRQPAAATLRQALRHYLHLGPWCLGAPGLREDVEVKVQGLICRAKANKVGKGTKR